MSPKKAVICRLMLILTTVCLIFVLVIPNAGAHYYGRRWECLAHYESTHQWHYNGPYDGGLQFSPTTWRTYTGRKAPDYAWQATKKFQKEVGRRVYRKGFGRHAPQGWTAWRNNWWKCN